MPSSASSTGRSNSANPRTGAASGPRGGGWPGASLRTGQDATPYPYILVLGQDDNEMIMGENLGDWRQVRWNTELVGLEQDAAA